jgi:hypothetical protein
LIWVINVDLDREKELIEKINRLEEEIDMSNNIQKTFNSDLKKQLDNQEGGLIMLFWGGVVAIVIFAFVLL